MFPKSAIGLNLLPLRYSVFFLADLKICSVLHFSALLSNVSTCGGLYSHSCKKFSVIISSKLLLPYYLTCFSLGPNISLVGFIFLFYMSVNVFCKWPENTFSTLWATYGVCHKNKLQVRFGLWAIICQISTFCCRLLFLVLNW